MPQRPSARGKGKGETGVSGEQDPLQKKKDAFRRGEGLLMGKEVNVEVYRNRR
jgi:hypothetical protein